MRLLRIVLLVALSFTLLLQIGSGEESKIKKVKCKEHIDAALKQYWDHEKGFQPPNFDVTDEEDGDSSEEQVTAKVLNLKSNGHHVQTQDEEQDGFENNEKNVTIESKNDESDESKEDESEEMGVKNKEKTDHFKKQNEESEEDSDENDENGEDNKKKVDKLEVKNLAKEKEKKEYDDDDDDDDDEDSKEKLKSDSKTHAKKKEKEESEEDDYSEEVLKSKKQIKETKQIKKQHDKDDQDNSDEDDDDDSKENQEPLRSRSHIEQILKLDEIGTAKEQEEQNLIASTFRELKRIYENAIKPLEQLYKYRSITNRQISDAEIFAKPLVVFLGAKSSGKSTLINYLLGLQNTEWALPTGQSTSPLHFTIVSHGKEYAKQSSIEFAADMTFSSLQQFGDKFIEQRVHSYQMPLDILQRMTIVDCPSLVENPQKPSETALSTDSQVYQWFFDRSDVIYLTLDVNQLQVSSQMQTILEQLKGRDVRFILNKVDNVKHGELILLIGQLFWMLSPLMPADRPPQVYALTTAPLTEYDVFLDGQEQLWLVDLRSQVLGVQRVESRIAAVRRHAVRVRNHAKLVDCYLAAYYRSKGLFTFGQAAKQLAAQITANPHDYAIFQAAQRANEQLTKYSQTANKLSANVRVDNEFTLNTINADTIGRSTALTANVTSRYDLPDAHVYRAFFTLHNLLQFPPLSATCSFFRGCPLDKLDVAIAYQLPDLLAKYRKQTKLH